MVDTTLLLKNLEDYRDSLRRHVASTREEFSRLQSDWMVLVDVYEGAARQLDVDSALLRTQDIWRV